MIGLGSVWIQLIFVENWKHCSKIIFKCVNSVVGPIFNEKMAEKCMNSTKQCVNSNFCPPIETRAEGKKKKAETRPSQNVEAIISIQTTP